MDLDELLEIIALDPKAITDEELCAILLEEQCEHKKTFGQYKKYPRFDKCLYTNEEFKINFWFEKQGFAELFTVLHLKCEYCLKDSRLTWSGEEGMALLLRHMSYPNRWNDLVPMFGRHIMELSHICNCMVNEIIGVHGHKLEMLNFDWIDPETFAKAVHDKGYPLDNIWVFIDGTLQGMCRPGEDQESYFSSYKRKHGLKYQSLLCPNGLIAHCAGPVEGRRHDSYMYFLSGLEKLSNVTGMGGRQMAIFGDTAYALRRYLLKPFKGNNLT